ncbi:hypothetical protein Ciccas_006869, partial [Cichlidogyrus casuarinus]
PDAMNLLSVLSQQTSPTDTTYSMEVSSTSHEDFLTFWPSTLDTTDIAKYSYPTPHLHYEPVQDLHPYSKHIYCQDHSAALQTYCDCQFLSLVHPLVVNCGFALITYCATQEQAAQLELTEGKYESELRRVPTIPSDSEQLALAENLNEDVGKE